MSLSVVLVGIDGIVVASDTREMITFGEITFPRDGVHKIKVISDSIVLSVIGNLAGYCNFLVTYFTSKELAQSLSGVDDIDSFVDAFSEWAGNKYRKATQGMSPVLLRSDSNLFEIVVVGYKGSEPRMYIIHNSATEPALIPHLIEALTLPPKTATP